nr:MAG TPA: hypothetical protein [Caudoviricetes sp.]
MRLKRAEGAASALREDRGCEGAGHPSLSKGFLTGY